VDYLHITATQSGVSKVTYDNAINEAARLSGKYSQPVYILGRIDYTDEYEFRAAFDWERESFYMAEDVFAIVNPDGSLADVEAIEL
jgi:hypothetical protein